MKPPKPGDAVIYQESPGVRHNALVERPVPGTMNTDLVFVEVDWCKAKKALNVRYSMPTLAGVFWFWPGDEDPADPTVAPVNVNMPASLPDGMKPAATSPTAIDVADGPRENPEHAYVVDRGAFAVPKESTKKQKKAARK